MEKYDFKNNTIKPHNILFAITSERDYEMSRLLLLEDMPNTNNTDFVLAEGYHCSCYDFNETEWNCVQLTEKELNKILEKDNWGLRRQLKDFLEKY